MRILHVDASRGDRGGQRQLLLLARQLARTSGIESLTAVRPDAPLYRALRSEGLPVEPIALRGALWGTRALASLARRFGATGLAAHDRHASVHARRLSWPWVAHRRVDFAPGLLGARRYAQASGVIAVSEAVADVLRALGLSRLAVVRDGVEPLPLPDPDPEGVRREIGARGRLLFAAGALVPHKGHRFAVMALARLPGFSLAIAGDGPLRDDLRALAASLGVSERLFLLGQRADIGRWLVSSDVFVHPSVEEGLGQAVIEAWLSGIPLAVSQAGGLRELPFGVPFSPGDVEGLARAVLVASHAPRERPSPEQAWAYGAERMARETVSAYERFGLGGSDE